MNQAWPSALPDATPWPRITVVTAQLSSARPARSLSSILDQRYPNLECILVRASGLADQAPSGVAIVECAPDASMAAALNAGLTSASGDLLTWLHDDELAPGALASVALAHHTSGADLVIGACRAHEGGSPVGARLHAFADAPLPLTNLLDVAHPRPLPSCSLFFTRELWERTGARLSSDWQRCWGHDLLLRFAEAEAHVHVIGRPVGIVTDQAIDDVEREELPVVIRACCDRTGTQPPDPQASEPIRAVLLSDSGFRAGAGGALRRLGEALAQAGHHVQLLATDDIRWASGDDVADAIAPHAPDVVLISSTNDSLAPGAIDRVAATFPTAIYLHDLWMLTGGCAYPGGCTRFITGCDQRCTCHTMHPHTETGSQLAWAAKRHVLSQPHAPALLAPSRWLHAQIEDAAARDSAMQARSARVRLGVNTMVFRPRDVSMCRELLGLDPDAFIIATAAPSLADERKGLVHLADAVKLLDLPNVRVVAAGRAPAHRKPAMGAIQMLGHIDDPLHLAMLYGAADIVVGPCTSEAFGQVFIEAAACGTPSVGFPAGGVPEAILDGISGRLAETISARVLADAIAELHADPQLRASMGTLGRLWVEGAHSMSASVASLVSALHEVGLGARLGLSRRLDLALDPVSIPPPVQMTLDAPFWSAAQGFAGWERAEVKLEPGRWALGPVSRLTLHARRGGPHVVALRLRNLLEGQRLRMMINGLPACEMSIPVTGRDDEHLVKLDAPLEPGDNAVELHTWRWDQADEHALLVVGVHALRCGGA